MFVRCIVRSLDKKAFILSDGESDDKDEELTPKISYDFGYNLSTNFGYFMLFSLLSLYGNFFTYSFASFSF